MSPWNLDYIFKNSSWRSEEHINNQNEKDSTKQLKLFLCSPVSHLLLKMSEVKKNLLWDQGYTDETLSK